MITLIPGELERFLEQDDGKPVVMLNLLRFRPDGGRERYSAYLAKAGPLVARFGAEIVFVGEGLPALSAEEGQAWDSIALVRYPHRRAFADMARDPEYEHVAGPMRQSALLEAVLQPIQLPDA